MRTLMGWLAGQQVLKDFLLRNGFECNDLVMVNNSVV